MKPFKVKIKKSIGNRKVEIKSNFGSNYCVTIQSVFYDCTNPSSYLRLLDSDGDMFMFKVPGQAEPNPTTPEVPVTVRLPIYYVDSLGDNEITIWGVVNKIDRTESGFDTELSI
jgi:hypothetical protein